MNLPSRRQLGATTLVIAAVGAFLVPFLMHSNARPTSPTAPGGGNNNTNGGGTTPTTPTTPSGDKDKSASGDTGSTGNNDHGEHSGDTGESGSSEKCTATQSSQSNQSNDSKIQDGQTGDHKTGNSDQLDPHGSGKHNTDALGLMKNKLDTTVALVRSMGAHNPAFHLQHDTDTDNEAGHSQTHVTHSSVDNDSSCDATDTEKDD